MENDKVKELLEIMENHNLSEISLETPDGFKIAMKKAEAISENVIVKPVAQVVAKETPKEEPKTEEKRGNIVKSPMVGTFYAKPSPTSNQYVDIGSTVSKGDTLCIIEAMKLMNEIESDYSGKVTEILVKDGETVEYGTPLFVIE